MRRVPLLLAGLLSAAMAPADLGAQATKASSVVEDREQEYDWAHDAYGAAFINWEIKERDWGRLMNEYEIVSASEDDARIAEKLAQIQDLSGQRSRAVSVLRTRKESWYEAGEALIDALDSYLAILSDEAQRSSAGSSRDDLLALYDHWNFRLQEVEMELGPRQPLDLMPVPEVEVREGDGPRDLRFKATLLEQRVGQAERLVEDIDRDIEHLSGRQRRERAHNNFLNRLNRFDDTGVPVDARSSRGDVSGDGGVSDTTAVNLALEPIAARIQRLMSTREEVIGWMSQLRERAEDFRKLAGGES